MRLARPALLLTATLALVATTAAPTLAAPDACAGGAVPAEPVVACGSLTVAGSGGSTLRLDVPRDTVLALSRAGVNRVDMFKNARFAGDGVAQGLLLTDNTLPSEGGSYLYVWHLGPGYYDSVQDFADGNLAEDPERENGYYLIPAGTYSLYLAGAGAVTVDLLFEGLDGAASYQPTRSVPLDFDVLDNHVADPAGTGQHNTWSAGQATTFATRGFQAMTWAVQEPTEAADWVGFCRYYDRPENSETAYLPYCPNQFTEDATVSTVDAGFGITPLTIAQAFAADFGGPGGQAMGFWKWSTAPSQRIGAVAFAVELDLADTT